MKRWTVEEVEFIKKYYPSNGAGYCANKLKRTPESIMIKARLCKIKRDGTSRYNRKKTTAGYSHCWICDEILPDGQFYKKTPEGKYGKKSNICRGCNQKKARHYYGEYKWKVFDRRDKDPIHFIYIRLKGSSKKRGIHFNLTEQDLRDKWNTHCPIYKKTLVFFSNSDWSPSIDRINNKIGYTKENIVVVSTKANMQKNNTTVEELKLLYNFYSSIKIDTNKESS
jgi:hypothetical protein